MDKKCNSQLSIVEFDLDFKCSKNSGFFLGGLRGGKYWLYDPCSQRLSESGQATQRRGQKNQTAQWV